MRRTMDIAATDVDPNCTDEMLDRFALVDPTKVPVYSTFEDTPSAIGYCTRLWREGPKLWADLEIDESAQWPSSSGVYPADLHAECLVGYRGKTADLLGVIITSMPRGTLAETIQGAFEVLRGTD
jgi:hypothetical protein